MRFVRNERCFIGVARCPVAFPHFLLTVAPTHGVGLPVAPAGNLLAVRSFRAGELEGCIPSRRAGRALNSHRTVENSFVVAADQTCQRFADAQGLSLWGAPGHGRSSGPTLPERADARIHPGGSQPLLLDPVDGRECPGFANRVALDDPSPEHGTDGRPLLIRDAPSSGDRLQSLHVPRTVRNDRDAGLWRRQWSHAQCGHSRAVQQIDDRVRVI